MPPKRMTALLLGFAGTAYRGMQIQPTEPTVEGALFAALVRAGAVSASNADDPTKVSLGRAARTDAGVHAAGNVVSIKLILDIPDWLARVNAELPPDIRVWGKVRVQNGFNARLACDSRKYTYLFPSYLLLPLAHRRQWRADPTLVDTLRRTAAKFQGTHNFHNFTVGRDFSDRSNQRHIISIHIADPVVHGDTEWISVLFHGQSFMLHQRKMMSALVLSCRTGTPADIIDELYGPRTVFVPKMPALGLLLEYPIFDSYNRKIARANEKYDETHPDFRLPIDFEQYRDTIDAFKQTFIYQDMRASEDRYGIFDAWIRSIDAYDGDDLSYLNPQGIIPASAVIKKDVRRAKPFKERRRFDLTNVKDEED